MQCTITCIHGMCSAYGTDIMLKIGIDTFISRLKSTIVLPTFYFFFISDQLDSIANIIFFLFNSIISMFPNLKSIK